MPTLKELQTAVIRQALAWSSTLEEPGKWELMFDAQYDLSEACETLRTAAYIADKDPAE